MPNYAGDADHAGQLAARADEIRSLIGARLGLSGLLPDTYRRCHRLDHRVRRRGRHRGVDEVAAARLQET
jgi:hypothetical protein